jgi:hypothetical protein
MSAVGSLTRHAVLASLLAVAVGTGPLAIHLAGMPYGATTPTPEVEHAHHLHAVAPVPTCEPTDGDHAAGGPHCPWCTLVRWLPPVSSDAVAADLQMPRAAPASEPILLRDHVTTAVRSRAPPKVA